MDFTASTLSISTNRTYQDETPTPISRKGPSRVGYANAFSYLPYIPCQNGLHTPSEDHLLVPGLGNINDCKITQSALLIHLRADFINQTYTLQFKPIAPYLPQLSFPTNRDKYQSAKCLREAATHHGPAKDREAAKSRKGEDHSYLLYRTCVLGICLKTVTNGLSQDQDSIEEKHNPYDTPISLPCLFD